MNDTELYEYVRRLFGIGDWTEASGVPYHNIYRDVVDDNGQPVLTRTGKPKQELVQRGYVSLEVIKAKRQRTSRRVTCEELAITADYCKAHGIDIRHMSWLYKHLRDALQWHRARQRALATADLDEAINEAIAIEFTVPDSPWLDRLVRARGQHRQEVYEEWKSWREKAKA